MLQNNSDMIIYQPRLGRNGMILLITLCSLMAPLSTDMYMPALPEMKEYFQTDDSIMNLTLVGFFLVFAVGMLFFGPISDRNGRKPILILGILLYVAGSIGCTLSGTIELLIAMRIVQALGAGSMVSVSTAIVRDQFTGMVQGSVLAISQIFSVLGPILSPVIGAFVYQLLGWRMVFVAQGAVTLLILIVAVLMKETLPEDARLNSGILRSFLRLGAVMKNQTFTLFMFGIIFLNIPMMAYIGASSYIYQDFFGLSPTLYTAYFAVTALFSVIGPIIYAKVKLANAFTISFFLLGTSVVCGLLMLCFGHSLPLVFAALIALMMMAAAASRPFATTILLNLQEKDTGAASSLINFSFTIMGTLGMYMITGIWNDYILGIAILMIISGLCGAAFITVLFKIKGSIR